LRPIAPKSNYSADAIEGQRGAGRLVAGQQRSAWHRRFISLYATSLRSQADAQQPHGDIGFLPTFVNMNVGMTQTRRKLLLVGNSSTLSAHPFFNDSAGLCEADRWLPHRTGDH
jgi:hypothetical protein